ncbi:unnamed protein product, partial [Durusdinium trenchii]
MAAVQGCLCILSSQMVLHVYDLKSQQSRKFSWGTSAVPGSGGVPACSGASLVPEPLGGFLCTYDWHHEALLRLWPRQGRAEALRLMLPVGASCAGRLKELPVLVFFGGQEVVLVATEGVQVARLRVSTGEIEDMMELSVKRLLLRCGEVFWELQLGSLQPTSASDFFHQLHQLRSLQLHPVTWTSSTSPPRAPLAPPSLREALGPWSASEAPLPELPELAELGRFGTLSTATSHVMAAPKTSFALLAVGLNLNLPSTPIWEYPRLEAPAQLLAQLTGEEVNMELTHKMVHCWHHASQSLISIFSIPGSSPLRARFGMVLLEALDLSSGHLRRLVLGKVPGLGLKSRTHSGPGTDGSLATQGLLLTQRNPERGRVERLEMPECIACCELEDGRLVLLFADSQIRIVELRMDTLALQEATYRNMMGRRDAEDTTAG